MPTNRTSWARRPSATGAAGLVAAVAAVCGPALGIGVDRLLAAADASATLRAVLLRYVQTFIVQSAHSSLANAHHRIEARLARWLLMCHDRVEGDVLNLTHELLSLMLGVRRAGVTVAIHLLEGRGLIKATRGHIRVLNRGGLEATAQGSYGVPEAEYARLLSGHRS